MTAAPDTPTFRYPGSRPFGHSELERELFRGRDEEAEELLYSVLGSNFTVLYAASGSGKTSLLEASVMHLLRDRDFFPVLVRLNEPSRNPTELIHDAMLTAAASMDVDVEVAERTTDTVWDLLTRVDVWRDDVLLTPILVFDQFEELFNLAWESRVRRRFIAELGQVTRGYRPRSGGDGAEGELLDLDKPPDARFVVSIREDSLGDLEALANDVPQVFTNRVRLLPLGIRSAGVAMCEPAALEAPGLTSPAFTYDIFALKLILDFVRTRQVRGEELPTKSVAATQMQIICSHVERKIVPSKAKDRDGKIRITAADLDGREGISRILQHFYRDQLAQLPDDVVARVRALCETGLIMSGGRRLSLDEEVVSEQFGVRPATLNRLVELNLLRAEPRLGSVYYELAHDVLVEPILAHREAIEEERRIRRGRRLAALAVIVPLAIVVWLVGRLLTSSPVVVAQEESITIRVVESPATSTIGFSLPITGDAEERSSGAFTVNGPFTSADRCNGEAPCVQVTYAPKEVGTHSATFSYEDADGTDLSLRLTGTADRPLEPILSISELDDVVVGAMSSATITVQNPEVVPMRAELGLGPSNGPFSISDDDCRSLAPGATCSATVAFTPSEIRTVEEQLTLAYAYEGDPEEERRLSGPRIVAEGLAAPNPPADEQMVDFGEVFVGASAARTIELTNSNRAALAIDVNLESESFLSTSCRAELASGETCDMVVSYEPRDASISEGVLVVRYTTGAGELDLEIDLRGVGRPEPLPPVGLPQRAAFGDVVIGSANALIIQIENPPGQDAVFVATIGGDETDAFSISSNECASAPVGDAGCAVTVRFSPTQADRFSAELLAKYGSESAGVVQHKVADLTGVGVEGVPFEVAQEAIPVGSDPVALAVGAGAVWVSNIEGLAAQSPGGSVSRIDLDDLAVTEAVRLDPQTDPGAGSPDGIAVTGDTLWLVDTRGNLYRIDTATCTPACSLDDKVNVARGDVASGAFATNKLAVGHGAVWVTEKANQPDGSDSSAGWVHRVDVTDLRVTHSLSLPGRVFDIATGPNAVWVTLLDDDLVIKIDPQAVIEDEGDEALEEISVGDTPIGIAVADDGMVWVANNGSDTVSIIDSATNTVSSTPVGLAPDGVAVGEGSVWVTNGDDSTVTRIDQSRIEQEEFTVGEGPDGIAVGAGVVWVANTRDDSVVVIGRPSGLLSPVLLSMFG